MGESWRDMALRLSQGNDAGGKGGQASYSQNGWKWPKAGWTDYSKGKGKNQGAATDKGKGKGKGDAGKGSSKATGKGKGGQDWPCPEPRCKELNGDETFWNRKSRTECFNCGLPHCAAPDVAKEVQATKEELRAKLKEELARSGPTLGGAPPKPAAASAAVDETPDAAMQEPVLSKDEKKRLATLGLPLQEMAAEEGLYRPPAKKDHPVAERVVVDALAGVVSEATARKRAGADFLKASLVQMRSALGSDSKLVAQAEEELAELESVLSKMARRRCVRARASLAAPTVLQAWQRQ